MRRRDFMALAGAAMPPLAAARAQAPTRVARVGFLSPRLLTAPQIRDLAAAFDLDLEPGSSQ